MRPFDVCCFRLSRGCSYPMNRIANLPMNVSSTFRSRPNVWASHRAISLLSSSDLSDLSQ